MPCQLAEIPPIATRSPRVRDTARSISGAYWVTLGRIQYRSARTSAAKRKYAATTPQSAMAASPRHRAGAGLSAGGEDSGIGEI